MPPLKPQAVTSPRPAGPGPDVKAARKAAGLTLEALAGLLASSPMAISKVELGHKVPSLEWLYEAARALRCPASSLDPRLNDAVPPPAG